MMLGFFRRHSIVLVTGLFCIGLVVLKLTGALDSQNGDAEDDRSKGRDDLKTPETLVETVGEGEVHAKDPRTDSEPLLGVLHLTLVSKEAEMKGSYDVIVTPVGTGRPAKTHARTGEEVRIELRGRARRATFEVRSSEPVFHLLAYSAAADPRNPSGSFYAVEAWFVIPRSSERHLEVPVDSFQSVSVSVITEQHVIVAGEPLYFERRPQVHYFDGIDETEAKAQSTAFEWKSSPLPWSSGGQGIVQTDSEGTASLNSFCGRIWIEAMEGDLIYPPEVFLPDQGLHAVFTVFRNLPDLTVTVKELNRKDVEGMVPGRLKKSQFQGAAEIRFFPGHYGYKSESKLTERVLTFPGSRSSHRISSDAH